MVLIPGDTDYINLLRRIRQEIAQDRTDIQRLMRVMRRAEFLEFPIPEVDAVGEESSSASASMSMSESASESSSLECSACALSLPLYCTVTQIYTGTTPDDTQRSIWKACIGSWTMDVHEVVSGILIIKPSVCQSVSPISQAQPRILCFASSILPQVTYYTSGTCLSGSVSVALAGVNKTHVCDPFYIYEESPILSDYSRFSIEITE